MTAVGTPSKVLVDRNIRVHAVRGEPAAQEVTLEWESHVITSEIHGYRGKALPEGEWLARQIRRLPTIARLAKEERLILYTSRELSFEAMNAARGFQGSTGDLFRDIPFKDVPAAIERSYFRGSTDFSRYWSGSSQAEFYEQILLKVDEQQIPPPLEQALPEFDLQNLRNLQRYRHLCTDLRTSDHRRDAFHLWTAEVNDLDFFLTADRRFINVMTQTKNHQSPTPPVCPEDLLNQLGVTELDPLPLTDGRFRNLFEPES